jgi:hypothetical protein
VKTAVARKFQALWKEDRKGSVCRDRKTRKPEKGLQKFSSGLCMVFTDFNPIFGVNTEFVRCMIEFQVAKYTNQVAMQNFHLKNFFPNEQSAFKLAF